MDLQRLKIDDIKVPETRVTARFDSELWEQFQASIKATGQISPIIVYQVDGDLVLCDGLHRLVEYRSNGEEYIDAVVIPGDMADVLTKNIFVDHLRGKTPVSEMVNVIEVLWKELQLDSEAIAAKTGMTRDYVERLQTLTQLTPLIRQSLDDGDIGVGHAYELTRLQDPVKQETVFHQLRLYRWTVRELKDYVRQVASIIEEQESVPETTPAPEPIKLQCKFCGGYYEIHQVSNPTTCISCSGVMYQAVAMAKVEAERPEPAQNEP